MAGEDMTLVMPTFPSCIYRFAVISLSFVHVVRPGGKCDKNNGLQRGGDCEDTSWGKYLLW